MGMSKIIAKAKKPIWSYYYGSTINDRIIEITVTELSNTEYKVEDSSGYKATVSSREEAMNLFNIKSKE